MASALSAQPNAKPVTGTPPTGPCSIVQVTWPCRSSSTRMRGTSAETPKPSAATSPTASSIRRGAITFSMPNGAASSAPRSTLTSPDKAGSYGVSVACIWSGSTTTTSTSEQGTCTARVGSGAAVARRLTWAITEAAGVARGERQIERAERRRLVLHRDVAAGVRGGAANDRHVRPQRAKVQPLVAIELDHAHEVLARARFILPPSRRGSTKVSSPSCVRTPAPPAAPARSISKIRPLGRLYASIASCRISRQIAGIGNDDGPLG